MIIWRPLVRCGYHGFACRLEKLQRPLECVLQNEGRGGCFKRLRTRSQPQVTRATMAPALEQCPVQTPSSRTQPAPALPENDATMLRTQTPQTITVTTTTTTTRIPSATPPPAVSFYRRPLPATCIALDSAEGRALFERSLFSGLAEPFLPLVSQFTTQSEPAFCGLGSLAMVLNALQVDPGRPWKGPWRWFSEELLDCCLPLHIVAREGITLDEFRCLGQCNGALVETAQPPAPGVAPSQHLSLERFRESLQRMCSDRDPRNGSGFLVLCYAREALQQTGTGHFSPIAAYDEVSDRALILDVARFKYPPHWVALPDLYRAMSVLDPATGMPRGLAMVRRRPVVEASGTSNRTPVPSEDASASTVRPCAWRPRLLHMKRLSTQQETARALTEVQITIRGLMRGYAIAMDEKQLAEFMETLIQIWTLHLSRHLAVTPLRIQDANTSCECSSSRRLLLDALQKSPLLRAYRQLGIGKVSADDVDPALCAAAEAVMMVGLLEYAARIAATCGSDPAHDGFQALIKRLLGDDERARDETRRIADVLAGFVDAAQQAEAPATGANK
jgi:glutathione gamma-glutamylcysteinyltransferase